MTPWTETHGKRTEIASPIQSKRVAVKFGEIAEFKNGINFKANGKSESIKILGVGDFQNHAEILGVSNLSEVPIDRALSEKDLLKDGDLVFVRSNGSKALVGRCVIVFPKKENLTHSGFTIRARIFSDQYFPRFISLLMQNGFLKSALQKGGRGTNISNLNQEVLSNLLIPNFSKQVQSRLLDFTQQWDLAIGKTELLITAKEKQLQWLRRQITTGKTRLPSSVGKWKKVRLGEVLTEHGEMSTGKEEVCSVSVHKGVVNQVEHLGRVFAAKNTSNYNLVKPGDIIYTKSPTGNFPLGIIKQCKLGRKVIVSPLYGVFTPNSTSLGVILDCYFESEVNTKNYLSPIVQKGAKNTISITNAVFLSNTLFLPIDLQEQKRIASILSTAREEIDLLKKKAEAYRKQKRGLMQKLLTGRWRVK